MSGALLYYYTTGSGKRIWLARDGGRYLKWTPNMLEASPFFWNVLIGKLACGLGPKRVRMRSQEAVMNAKKVTRFDPFRAQRRML